MNLLVYDEEFLEKQDEIWDKVKDLIKNNLKLNKCVMINNLKLK